MAQRRSPAVGLALAWTLLVMQCSAHSIIPRNVIHEPSHSAPEQPQMNERSLSDVEQSPMNELSSLNEEFSSRIREQHPREREILYRLMNRQSSPHHEERRNQVRGDSLPWRGERMRQNSQSPPETFYRPATSLPQMNGPSKSMDMYPLTREYPLPMNINIRPQINGEQSAPMNEELFRQRGEHLAEMDEEMQPRNQAKRNVPLMDGAMYPRRTDWPPIDYVMRPEDMMGESGGACGRDCDYSQASHGRRPIELVHTGNPCTCLEPMPVNIERPAVAPAPQRFSYGYRIEQPPPCPECPLQNYEFGVERAVEPPPVVMRDSMYRVERPPPPAPCQMNNYGFSVERPLSQPASIRRNLPYTVETIPLPPQCPRKDEEFSVDRPAVAALAPRYCGLTAEIDRMVLPAPGCSEQAALALDPIVCSDPGQASIDFGSALATELNPPRFDSIRYPRAISDAEYAHMHRSRRPTTLTQGYEIISPLAPHSTRDDHRRHEIVKENEGNHFLNSRYYPNHRNIIHSKQNESVDYADDAANSGKVIHEQRAYIQDKMTKIDDVEEFKENRDVEKFQVLKDSSAIKTNRKGSRELNSNSRKIDLDDDESRVPRETQAKSETKDRISDEKMDRNIPQNKAVTEVVDANIKDERFDWEHNSETHPTKIDTENVNKSPGRKTMLEDFSKKISDFTSHDITNFAEKTYLRKRDIYDTSTDGTKTEVTIETYPSAATESGYSASTVGTSVPGKDIVKTTIITDATDCSSDSKEEHLSAHKSGKAVTVTKTTITKTCTGGCLEPRYDDKTDDHEITYTEGDSKNTGSYSSDENILKELKDYSITDYESAGSSPTYNTISKNYGTETKEGIESGMKGTYGYSSSYGSNSHYNGGSEYHKGYGRSYQQSNYGDSNDYGEDSKSQYGYSGYKDVVKNKYGSGYQSYEGSSKNQHGSYGHHYGSSSSKKYGYQPNYGGSTNYNDGYFGSNYYYGGNSGKNYGSSSHNSHSGYYGGTSSYKGPHKVNHNIPEGYILETGNSIYGTSQYSGLPKYGGVKPPVTKYGSSYVPAEYSSDNDVTGYHGLVEPKTYSSSNEYKPDHYGRKTDKTYYVPKDDSHYQSKGYYDSPPSGHIYGSKGHKHEGVFEPYTSGVTLINSEGNRHKYERDHKTSYEGKKYSDKVYDTSQKRGYETMKEESGYKINNVGEYGYNSGHNEGSNIVYNSKGGYISNDMTYGEEAGYADSSYDSDKKIVKTLEYSHQGSKYNSKYGGRSGYSSTYGSDTGYQTNHKHRGSYSSDYHGKKGYEYGSSGRSSYSSGGEYSNKEGHSIDYKGTSSYSSGDVSGYSFTHDSDAGYETKHKDSSSHSSDYNDNKGYDDSSNDRTSYSSGGDYSNQEGYSIDNRDGSSYKSEGGYAEEGNSDKYREESESYNYDKKKNINDGYERKSYESKVENGKESQEYSETSLDEIGKEFGYKTRQSERISEYGCRDNPPHKGCGEDSEHYMSNYGIAKDIIIDSVRKTDCGHIRCSGPKECCCSSGYQKGTYGGGCGKVNSDYGVVQTTDPDYSQNYAGSKSYIPDASYSYSGVDLSYGDRSKNSYYSLYGRGYRPNYGSTPYGPNNYIGVDLGYSKKLDTDYSPIYESSQPTYSAGTYPIDNGYGSGTYISNDYQSNDGYSSPKGYILDGNYDSSNSVSFYTPDTSLSNSYETYSNYGYGSSGGYVDGYSSVDLYGSNTYGEDGSKSSYAVPSYTKYSSSKHLGYPPRYGLGKGYNIIGTSDGRSSKIGLYDLTKHVFGYKGGDWLSLDSGFGLDQTDKYGKIQKRSTTESKSERTNNSVDDMNLSENILVLNGNRDKEFVNIRSINGDVHHQNLASGKMQSKSTKQSSMINSADDMINSKELENIQERNNSHDGSKMPQNSGNINYMLEKVISGNMEYKRDESKAPKKVLVTYGPNKENTMKIKKSYKSALESINHFTDENSSGEIMHRSPFIDSASSLAMGLPYEHIATQETEYNHGGETLSSENKDDMTPEVGNVDGEEIMIEVVDELKRIAEEKENEEDEEKNKKDERTNAKNRNQNLTFTAPKTLPVIAEG